MSDEGQVMSNDSQGDSDLQNLVCGATERRDLVVLKNPINPATFCGPAFEFEGIVEPEFMA